MERIMTKKSNKNVYIVAFALFLGALGFLLFSGLSQNSVYFMEVSEALAMPQHEIGSARLFGTVDGANIKHMQTAPGVTFRLLDSQNKSQGIWVTYKGVLPDTFKAEAEVIVEGKMPTDSETFNATTLMTKCPSKYQKENRDT